MIRIGIIGTGYVGLVTGACLSDFGMQVTCMDIDQDRIENLKKGILPFYEPSLDEFVKRNVDYKRLFFTSDITTLVEENDVLFICVGTPPTEDGSTDLQYVLAAASDIGNYINHYKVIVTKSTVPIGTGRKVQNLIDEKIKQRNREIDFDLVSNPEFLRQGNAIEEFTHTTRIVIGCASEKAKKLMKQVYRVLYLNHTPFIEVSIETAEMIKYANNAFLATKISFINELANLCEIVGADIHHIANALGMDGRINPKFLHPGPGYGGSCFPKDTRSLANEAKKLGSPLTIVEAVISSNEYQKEHMVQKIKSTMGGSLSDKTIAVLGLTFKPRTDDMREAPSLVILPQLAEAGATLKLFDPQGTAQGPWRFEKIKNQITFCNNEYEAIQNSHALLILTEWNHFRNLDICRLKELMIGNYFFDFRNIYERSYIEAYEFIYDCIGR
jgi:UDPglucose 6-dehydrogenase